MRRLPGHGLVARSNQESQSHSLTLPQLTSGFGPWLWRCASGLPFGKFARVVCIAARLGAWDPTVQVLARQPCLALPALPALPCPGDAAVSLQAGRDHSHGACGAACPALLPAQFTE